MSRTKPINAKGSKILLVVVGAVAGAAGTAMYANHEQASQREIIERQQAQIAQLQRAAWQPPVQHDALQQQPHAYQLESDPHSILYRSFADREREAYERGKQDGYILGDSMRPDDLERRYETSRRPSSQN